MKLIHKIESALQAVADAEGDASVSVDDDAVYYDALLTVAPDPPDHALVSSREDDTAPSRVHIDALVEHVRVAVKKSA